MKRVNLSRVLPESRDVHIFISYEIRGYRSKRNLVVFF
jgi:hypothetical protein